jgi:GINS complex subunit 1
MYGDLAGKLIQDSRRTQNLEALPLYQEDAVRGVVREIRDLDRDIERTMSRYDGEFQLSQDRKTSCGLFVQHLCMRRNKRCLLAYQHLRADRIREMAWRDVDSTDNGIVNNLHPNEQEYWRQYSELLSDYKGEWTEIDLTGSLEPPRDLFIDVRVLKDAGEIQTEYGYVFSIYRNCEGHDQCANPPVCST